VVVEGWEGFEVGGEAFGGDAVEDLGFEELVGGAGLEVEDCVDGVGFFGGWDALGGTARVPEVFVGHGWCFGDNEGS